MQMSIVSLTQSGTVTVRMWPPVPIRSTTQNGRSGTLADSNERVGKGFVPTYAFARDYGGLVGRFKLGGQFQARLDLRQALY